MAQERPSTASLNRSLRKQFLEKLQQNLDRLYGYVKRQIDIHTALGDFLPQEITAEDIVAEVVARAGNNLQAFQSHRDRFYPWLIGIACEVLQREVHRARERHHSEESLYRPLRSEEPEDIFSDILRLEDVIPSSEPLPEDWVLLEEFQDLVNRVLASLPEDQRLAFLLHDGEGLTYEEVGRLMGFSRDKARRTVQRARARLRRYLQSAGVEEGDVVLSRARFSAQAPQQILEQAAHRLYHEEGPHEEGERGF